jgi:hypothetical protein
VCGASDVQWQPLGIYGQFQLRRNGYRWKVAEVCRRKHWRNRPHPGPLTVSCSDSPLPHSTIPSHDLPNQPPSQLHLHPATIVSSCIHLPPSTGIQFFSDTPHQLKLSLNSHLLPLHTAGSAHSPLLHPYAQQQPTPLVICILTHDQ